MARSGSDADRDNIVLPPPWQFETKRRRRSACDQAQRSGATGSCADSRPRGVKRSSACSHRETGSRLALAMAQSRVASPPTCKATAPGCAASARKVCLSSGSWARTRGGDHPRPPRHLCVGRRRSRTCPTLTLEGLELARRSGDLWTEAMLLANAGVVLAALGELRKPTDAPRERARGASERQHPQRRQLAAVPRRHRARSPGLRAGTTTVRGEPRRPPYVGRQLGDLASPVAPRPRRRGNGRSDRARQLLEESISIERGAGLRPGLAGSLEVAAKLAIDDGCLARAARLYARASIGRESDGGTLMEVGGPPRTPDRPDPCNARRESVCRSLARRPRDEGGRVGGLRA